MQELISFLITFLTNEGTFKDLETINNNKWHHKLFQKNLFMLINHTIQDMS